MKEIFETHDDLILREDLTASIRKDIEGKKSMILLTGAPGSGKSALLAQVTGELSATGYHVILLRGRTAPETILEALINSADGPELNDLFMKQLEFKDKLETLMELWGKKEKLVLVLEDFDVNLDDAGKFVNQRLHELISYLAEGLTGLESLMMIACRTELADLKEVQALDVPLFTPQQCEALIRRNARLNRLDEKSLKYAYFEMGGYPWAVQLCERAAAYLFGNETFQWPMFRERIPGLKERVMHKKNDDADFSYLLVDFLRSYLEPGQTRLLNVLAAADRTLPESAFSALGLTISPTDRDLLRQLFDVGYQAADTDAYYYLPRRTAQMLRGWMPDDDLDGIHLGLAEFFLTPSPHLSLPTSCRHFIAAGHIDRATELSLQLDKIYCGQWFPQLAFDLLQELPVHGMSDENQLQLQSRLSVLFALFGKLDDALNANQAALSLLEAGKNNEGLALHLDQAGMLHEAKGNYPQALTCYQKSLSTQEVLGNDSIPAALLEKIGSVQIKLGNYAEAFDCYEKALTLNRKTGNRIAEAADLEQLGRVLDEQGKFDGALNYYHQSIILREELKDQKGIATLKHQMGNVCFVKNEPDKAFDYYTQALALNQELHDRKNAGYSRGQIGLIQHRRGDTQAALEQYRLSLQDFEAVDEKKGMAAGYHQMGRIFQSDNDMDKALEHYLKALELRENAGDLLGSAITYGQLGLLYFQKDELHTSLRYSAKAYAVFSQYGSTNVRLARQNMLRIREKIPAAEFNEILEELNIKTDQGPEKK